jgi:hypothetical protein
MPGDERIEPIMWSMPWVTTATTNTNATQHYTILDDTLTGGSAMPLEPREPMPSRPQSPSDVFDPSDAAIVVFTRRLATMVSDPADVHRNIGEGAFACDACLNQYSGGMRFTDYPDSAGPVARSRALCVTCASGYAVSPCCGRWQGHGERHQYGARVGGRNTRLCRTCVNERNMRSCAHCGTMCDRGDLTNVGSRARAYCEPCLTGLFLWCDACEVYYDRNGECACEVRRNGTTKVHSYSYKPQALFFDVRQEAPALHPKPHKLYLGFELEVEQMRSLIPGSQVARELRASWLYCKTDGSLSQGIEIVSHPLSYEWIEAHRDDITGRLATLRQWGWRSFDTRTCGLHVHLSADAFTTLHLYKFLMLIYGNLPLATRIAERQGADLSRYAKINLHEVTGLHTEKSCMRGIKQSRKGRESGWSRYMAVNLDAKNTVELRLFRGTLNPRSFFKGLEFAHAAHGFTRDVSADDITTRGFRAWLKDRKKVYPHLVDFLDDASTAKVAEPGVIPAVGA